MSVMGPPGEKVDNLCSKPLKRMEWIGGAFSVYPIGKIRLWASGDVSHVHFLPLILLADFDNSSTFRVRVDNGRRAIASLARGSCIACSV